MTLATGQLRPDGAGSSIAARSPAAKSLAGQRERFVAFAFAAADLLVEASLDGVIQFASGAFQTQLGQPAERFIGRPITDMLAPIDHPGLRVVMAAAISHGRVRPVMLRLADRGQTPVSVAALLLHDRLCLTIGSAPAGSSEPLRNPPVLAEGSTPIIEAVAQSLQRPYGDGGQLGLIELQGWDRARERLTDSELDHLRAELAGVLTSVGPGGLASEIVEGRFGVLTPERLELDAVVLRLEEVLQASPAARETTVLGTGLALDGAVDPMQAARTLRFALTCFAERGTDGIAAVGGQNGLTGIIAHTEKRASAMRRGLLDRRFRLRYQPIRHLAGDRALHHYEALLRPLATPGNPLVSTQEYVNFAEAVGLAELLDRATLAEVLVVLKAEPNTEVAVNVSGLSMQSLTFRSHMLETVAATRLGPRLIVELTETSEISDMDQAALSMAALRQAGVRLCLDDFGAGAAGFRYLRAFPVDYVKIDGSYVRRAPTSPRERAFVGSIVELASAASAEVVAEMIETEEQAAMMQELGAQFGQGWLLGRPGTLLPQRSTPGAAPPAKVQML